MMVDLVLAVLVGGALDLVLPALATEPVYPRRGSGFAARVLGGIFGLALIIGTMVALNRKPPRR